MEGRQGSKRRERAGRTEQDARIRRKLTGGLLAVLATGNTVGVNDGVHAALVGVATEEPWVSKGRKGAKEENAPENTLDLPLVKRLVVDVRLVTGGRDPRPETGRDTEVVDTVLVEGLDVVLSHEVVEVVGKSGLRAILTQYLAESPLVESRGSSARGNGVHSVVVPIREHPLLELEEERQVSTRLTGRECIGCGRRIVWAGWSGKEGMGGKMGTKAEGGRREGKKERKRTMSHDPKHIPMDLLVPQFQAGRSTTLKVLPATAVADVLAPEEVLVEEEPVPASAAAFTLLLLLLLAALEPSTPPRTAARITTMATTAATIHQRRFLLPFLPTVGENEERWVMPGAFSPSLR
jgi:hypothetical protein